MAGAWPSREGAFRELWLGQGLDVAKVWWVIPDASAVSLTEGLRLMV